MGQLLGEGKSALVFLKPESTSFLGLWRTKQNAVKFPKDTENPVLTDSSHKIQG